MNPLFIIGAIALIVLVFGRSTPVLKALSTHPGLPDPPPLPPPPPPSPPSPPPRPVGLTFATRNVVAVHAVIDALLRDLLLNAATLGIYAEQFALYGFVDEAVLLRKESARRLSLYGTQDKTVPFHGW